MSSGHVGPSRKANTMFKHNFLKLPVNRTQYSTVLMAALALATSSAASAATFAGQTASGAYFQIETPANWQPGNGLVLINHGFTLDSPRPNPSLGEAVLRTKILSQGFAIAASSYSDSGWATFRIGQDYRELMSEFRRVFGAPGSIITAGGSLGGLVSIQLAELAARGEFDPVDGVLALCPAVGGSKIWDQAFDVRVSFDALCGGTLGGDLPNGLSSFPYALKPEDVAGGPRDSALIEVAAAGAKCLGMGVNSLLQTSGMRDRRARFNAINNTTDDAIPNLLYYATFGLTDLLFDPLKLNQQVGFDNRAVNYGDLAVDSSVRRVSADPLARYRMLRNYTPTGLIGSSKLLAVTTTADPILPAAHLAVLNDRFPPAQTRRILVKETAGTHCGFSEAELIGAWNTLSGWVKTGATPAVDTLPTTLNLACENARIGGPQNQPGVNGACRFQTAETVASLDTIIRSRPKDGPRIDGALNGDWYSPSRSGEGLKVESLGNGRVLVSVFTYPKTGVNAQQLWVTGIGNVSENGFSADLIEPNGARFGDAFRPGDVQRLPWGRMDMALTECGKAVMSITGPAGYETQTYTLEQLSRQRVPCNSRIAQPAFTGLSGNWYDPARSGEGIFLTVTPSRAAVGIWFTYTPDGKQAWVTQQGNLANQKIIGSSLRPIGARYGSAFNPAQVQREPFGQFEITFVSCNELLLNYQAPWGTGVRRLTRLSAPEGTEGCQVD